MFYTYLGPEIIQPGHIPKAPLVLSPISMVECKSKMKESESMYMPQDSQQKQVAQLINTSMKIFLTRARF